MSRRWWLGALLAAGAVAALLAPFASRWPDGLARVAGALGFGQRAVGPPPLAAPLSGYQVPGMTHPGVSTGLGGLLGTALVFALLYAAARLLAARAARRHADIPR
jgi:hypothetical protein